MRWDLLRDLGAWEFLELAEWPWQAPPHCCKSAKDSHSTSESSNEITTASFQPWTSPGSRGSAELRPLTSGKMLLLLRQLLTHQDSWDKLTCIGFGSLSRVSLIDVCSATPELLSLNTELPVLSPQHLPATQNTEPDLHWNQWCLYARDFYENLLSNGNVMGVYHLQMVLLVF